MTPQPVTPQPLTPSRPAAPRPPAPSPPVEPPPPATVAPPTAGARAPAPARVRGCCQPLAEPLPEARADGVAGLCRALGDPTRVQMLHLLSAAAEPICVCDFTAAFDLGQPTVSHHLARLRDAGLVRSHRRGIWAFYELVPDLPPLARAVLAELGAGLPQRPRSG